MIRGTVAGVALALCGATAALGCPEPSTTLLFHSCWGDARASVLLLPEDNVPEAPNAGRRLVVTGAYTGRVPRDGGKPNPVGFFMRGADIVNHHMARMDGLLLVDAEGALDLVARAKARLDGEVYDLRRVAPRTAFGERAAERGLSIMQSHLLIIDGEPDVSEQSDAPRFRRRILFTDRDGYGLYQTADAVTLYDAAEALDEAYAPQMALNLDMGSYDFCLASDDGIERVCGVLGRDQTEKLSNLLVLSLD